MQCLRCRHENSPRAKLCEDCAAPLVRTCPRCGDPVSPSAKFCSECAHTLAEPTAGQARSGSPDTYTPKHLAEEILTSRSALEGERKQVTVLFADLKGSMELLADRDPEEARKLLDPVLERMMEAVHRYEGTVNQAMGGGIIGAAADHLQPINCMEDATMRKARTYSRRQFFQVGAAGVAATTMTASAPGRGVAHAAVQSAPPANTAPRVLRKPPLNELQRIAHAYGLDLSPEDLTSFRTLMEGVLASYRRLDQFAEPTLPVKYPRDAGHRPPAAENRLNAWYWRCSIKGAAAGALAGKKIAIKDNVCVAGIPMMNGSNVLEGYVPDVDATLVTRILDAGGEIVGKAVCEHLCFSGGSHTSDTGPVLNPNDPKRSAGGSSSGSAALVVAGECDMAIGGDQGGSIRIPSSYSGAVGHKPTYGLVPYTGVFPIELTLDHTGPIARTAADCALLLEAIAGPDGLDPRQSGQVRTEAYTKALTGDARGLRIGIVREGFGLGNSEPDVDQMVRDAARRLAGAGAAVSEVSVPLHRDGVHIWNAIAVEGATMLMVAGNSMGTNWKGHYTTSLLDFYGRSRRARANDLSETVKLVILLGQYMQDNYQGRYYAKAQNLARVLRAAYDEALAGVDLLLMPTLPLKATVLPSANASREEYVARALEMIANTCPFDVTGHPAITVPVGKSAGLPVGMMLIGRHWEDGAVLRAADAFQKLG